MMMKKMWFVQACTYVLLATNFLQGQADQFTVSCPAGLDLHKINSSSIRSEVSFDALELSLAKIEQQLADTSAQVQKLKEHVCHIKQSTQEQMRADAQEKEKLKAQLYDAQEANASLEHQVVNNEVAECLGQEMSNLLATAAIEQFEDSPRVIAHACTTEQDSWQEGDEDVGEEYEDEV